VAGTDDRTAGYASRLPGSRPAGLRLTTVRHAWYRLDSEPPDVWSWQAFPGPRNRFDSAAGGLRVRYAGDEQRVAMRERFDEARRVVLASQLELELVELTGSVRVLDLRRDQTLDALGLDDQINTSRSPEVWPACHRLADLVHEWFGEQCHGIVYRSRTTPERSANLAFFAHAPLRARALGPLAGHERLLIQCAAGDGFRILGWR
jgi:hypothetical protein